MNEQFPQQPDQNLNISESVLQNVQIGGIAGRDLIMFVTNGQPLPMHPNDNFQWPTQIVSNNNNQPETSEEYRYRNALLTSVDQAWIKDFLDCALHTKVEHHLRLKKRPDAIRRPTHGIVNTAIESEITYEKGYSAETLFRDMGQEGRTLLILGEAGSGKTITLVKLAKSLIELYQEKPNLKLPVIFSLSFWAKKQKSIFAWLIDEFSDKYGIPRKLAHKWLKKGNLILLLDGLDEMKPDDRNLCAKKLNEFISFHPLTELVVCCRRKEYYEINVQRLKLLGAIDLQPLSESQVDNFLKQGGEQLKALRGLLQSNKDLQKIAQNPLILNVMSLAYRDSPIEDLSILDKGEFCLQNLFNDYINKMFQHRATFQSYSKAESIRYLKWLASKMYEHDSQAIFMIENIQPTWLNPIFQRWGYPMAVGLLSGVATEFTIGLTIGLTGDLLSLQMMLGLFIGLLIGIFSSLSNEIEILEKIGWSWSPEQLWKYSFFSILCGPLIGLSISFIGSITDLAVKGLLYDLRAGLEGGVLVALVMTFITIISGFSKGSIQKSIAPNQGIRQSAQRALISTLCASILMYGIFRIISFQEILTSSFGRPQALISITTASLSFIFLVTGGVICLQHFIVRIFLWSLNLVPWNYSHFLGYAEDMIFLQKIGGTYKFIHELIQKEFSEIRQEQQIFSFDYRHLIKPVGLSILFSIFIFGAFSIPLSFNAWLIDKAVAKVMAPRLQEGEHILINKTPYAKSLIKKGDVVIFKPPQKQGSEKPGYVNDIQEIVGVPGNEIEILDGWIYLEGKQLTQDALVNKGLINETKNFYQVKTVNLRLDTYFVLAINPDTNDERSDFYGGPIFSIDIIGRSSFRYWPIDRLGAI